MSVNINTARTILCFALILLLQFQSAAVHAYTSDKPQHTKLCAKEYNVSNSILPSSTKIEVINQEFPWMEEIHYKTEQTQKPVVDFTCISRIFFLDLFRIITPSNAP